MKFLSNLFENNQAWAEKNKREDPDYFERLSRTQSPEYLWIGCAVLGLCGEGFFIGKKAVDLSVSAQLHTCIVGRRSRIC